MDVSTGDARIVSPEKLQIWDYDWSPDGSQIVALVRERAASTPPGQWIITAADWHELQLAERHLPTSVELDQATLDRDTALLKSDAVSRASYDQARFTLEASKANSTYCASRPRMLPRSPLTSSP